MLSFELLPLEVTTLRALRERPVQTVPTCNEFPYYVEPSESEALLSWLLRLATRMGLPLHALAEHCFNVDDAQGYTQWWTRPHPWVLKRISLRTGVSVRRLRDMTFLDFEPVYRDDETNERFCGRRYREQAPNRRAYRLAVCGYCLESDASPYARQPWLLGWLAVCPRHECILIVRCSRCHAKCHVSHFTRDTCFSPTRCTRCGEDLFAGQLLQAAPSVVSLQGNLLKAKRTGAAEFAGFGVLKWEEMVALADVLLGMFWTARSMEERLVDYERYHRATLEEPSDVLGVYDGRYASLRFLAWLIAGWPGSEGACVGQQLLANWLRGGVKNKISAHLVKGGYHWSSKPDDFEPRIKERLRALLD